MGESQQVSASDPFISTLMSLCWLKTTEITRYICIWDLITPGLWRQISVMWQWRNKVRQTEEMDKFLLEHLQKTHHWVIALKTVTVTMMINSHWNNSKQTTLQRVQRYQSCVYLKDRHNRIRNSKVSYLTHSWFYTMSVILPQYSMRSVYCQRPMIFIWKNQTVLFVNLV